MHVQSFELMIFEQNPQASLQKDDPLHQKAYIKLLLHFIPTLIILLHQFPLDLTSKELQNRIEDIENECKEVKLR